MRTPYLTELKDLVLLHARAQGIRPAECASVLARVTAETGPSAGSWPLVWAAEGDRAADPLQASRRYNLARFPYVDGGERAEALARCVAAFGRWAATAPGVEALDVPVPGGTMRCWAAGLDRDRPLLVVTGGIVSIKEQWGAFLLAAPRLRMSVVVAEMPGVGENPLTYGPEAVGMFPAILDAVAGRARTEETYAVALSFGGNLALHWSLTDPRLRGLVTVGAPVSALFADEGVWARLPQTTVRTLTHLTRVAEGDVREHLSPLALTPARLGRIDIPVRYAVSRRDEIIPASEPRLLAGHLPRFRAVEFDDVHGSPNHLARTRLWVVGSLLRMRAQRRLMRRAVA
ncbi:alpha/beta fold hydrolase [Microbispora sp. NPDC049125]|uniref:alpha/beta fold hydrolase n=1 Tax=Microbispora sp. NPDC049125 TaxID=3154929 RepID=UPI003467CD63